jgi:glycosyltransferase involved in cell wall biosynthesis
MNAPVGRGTRSSPGDTHIVFIGEGGEPLAELARERGISERVHVLGYRDDADRWMALFDALVVPSRTEGQGLVVLEAFRGGVPVLASNIPALRELVSEDTTGWLFEADDPHSLAGAIQRVASTPDDVRNRIADSAATLFAERYTIEVMVARHQALYDDLLRQAMRRTPA